MCCLHAFEEIARRSRAVQVWFKCAIYLRLRLAKSFEFRQRRPTHIHMYQVGCKDSCGWMDIETASTEACVPVQDSVTGFNPQGPPLPRRSDGERAPGTPQGSIKDKRVKSSCVLESEKENVDPSTGEYSTLRSAYSGPLFPAGIHTYLPWICGHNLMHSARCRSTRHKVRG